MSSMFLQDLTVDENVIQIDLTEFMQTVEQHVVDIVTILALPGSAF